MLFLKIQEQQQKHLHHLKSRFHHLGHELIFNSIHHQGRGNLSQLLLQTNLMQDSRKILPYLRKHMPMVEVGKPFQHKQVILLDL